jgi:hypothetical protein
MAAEEKKRKVEKQACRISAHVAVGIAIFRRSIIFCSEYELLCAEFIISAPLFSSRKLFVIKN